MMDKLDNHFMMYVSQIIMLYTLKMCSARCQLYVNKTGKKRKEKEGEKVKEGVGGGSGRRRWRNISEFCSKYNIPKHTYVQHSS